MGFEPTYNGFANHCLTTWLPRPKELLHHRGDDWSALSRRNLTRSPDSCKSASTARINYELHEPKALLWHARAPCEKLG